MADRSKWPTLIRQLAARYGVDPRAALAVASVEGLSGGVGDGGHAFGPFQLNDAGGVITGRPGNHRAFAESQQGIDFAMRQIAKVAAGKKGKAAVNAIVRQFERPAAPDAEVQRALAAYGKTAGGATPLAPLRSSTGGTTTQPQPNQLASSLLQNLMAQNQAFASGGAVTQPPAISALLKQLTGDVSPNPPAASPGPDGAATGPLPRVKSTTSGRIKVIGDPTGLKPKFFSALQDAVLGSGGSALKITSGYRSPEHNAAIGGVQHSNHLTGDAVDGYALVGGKWVPLGVLLAKTAGKYGLRSGDQPGFYRGGPDYVHVDDFANRGI